MSEAIKISATVKHSGITVSRNFSVVREGLLKPMIEDWVKNEVPWKNCELATRDCVADYTEAVQDVLKELGVKYSILRCIRICLGTDGTAMYWPFFQGDDDYSSSPMDPEDALHEITGRGVPIEVACKDPQDEQPHNYEILLSNGESTSSSVQLQRI